MNRRHPTFWSPEFAFTTASLLGGVAIGLLASPFVADEWRTVMGIVIFACSKVLFEVARHYR